MFSSISYAAEIVKLLVLLECDPLVWKVLNRNSVGWVLKKCCKASRVWLERVQDVPGGWVALLLCYRVLVFK